MILDDLNNIIGYFYDAAKTILKPLSMIWWYTTFAILIAKVPIFWHLHVSLPIRARGLSVHLGHGKNKSNFSISIPNTF